MAAPTFDSSDVTVSGNTVLETSADVDYPAYSIGDLIIFAVERDNDGGITQPLTGINGETLLVDVEGFIGGAGPTLCIIAYKATSAELAGTLNFGLTAPEEWVGMCVVIPAGEFDATTPIDSVSGIGGLNSNSTTIPTPSWTCTNAGGRVVVFSALDTESQTGAFPADWTSVQTHQANANWGSLRVGYRDAETSALETIPSVNWPATDDNGDTSTAYGFVINGVAGGGGGVPLSVFQNANKVIN